MLTISNYYFTFLHQTKHQTDCILSDKTLDSHSRSHYLLFIATRPKEMRLPLISLFLLSSPLLTLTNEEEVVATNFPVVEDTVIHSVLVESCSG